jgi:hypothetical protein
VRISLFSRSPRVDGACSFAFGAFTVKFKVARKSKVVGGDLARKTLTIADVQRHNLQGNKGQHWWGMMATLTLHLLLRASSAAPQSNSQQASASHPVD